MRIKRVKTKRFGWRFYLIRQIGGGKESCEITPTKNINEANDYLVIKQFEEMEGRSLIVQKEITLKDFVEKFYLDESRKGVRPKKEKTVKSDQYCINVILKHLGHLKLQQIGGTQIDAFIRANRESAFKRAEERELNKAKKENRRIEPIQPDTGSRAIQKRLSHLQTILKYAMRLEYLRKLPDIPKVSYTPMRQDRVVSLSEYDLIVSNAEPLVKNIFTLMINTGMRICDAVDLRWENFHEDERRIVIPRPKNKDLLTLELNDAAFSTLKSLKGQGTGVFVFEHDGMPYSETYPSKRFKMLVVRLGIKDLTLYDVKRTCFTAHADNGASDRELQGITNHKTAKAASAYVQKSAMKHKLREAVSRLRFGSQAGKEQEMGHILQGGLA